MTISPELSSLLPLSLGEQDKRSAQMSPEAISDLLAEIGVLLSKENITKISIEEEDKLRWLESSLKKNLQRKRKVEKEQAEVILDCVNQAIRNCETAIKEYKTFLENLTEDNFFIPRDMFHYAIEAGNVYLFEADAWREEFKSVASSPDQVYKAKADKEIGSNILIFGLSKENYEKLSKERLKEGSPESHQEITSIIHSTEEKLRSMTLDELTSLFISDPIIQHISQSAGFPLTEDSVRNFLYTNYLRKIETMSTFRRRLVTAKIRFIMDLIDEKYDYADNMRMHIALFREVRMKLANIVNKNPLYVVLIKMFKNALLKKQDDIVKMIVEVFSEDRNEKTVTLSFSGKSTIKKEYEMRKYADWDKAFLKKEFVLLIVLKIVELESLNNLTEKERIRSALRDFLNTNLALVDPLLIRNTAVSLDFLITATKYVENLLSNNVDEIYLKASRILLEDIAEGIVKKNPHKIKQAQLVFTYEEQGRRKMKPLPMLITAIEEKFRKELISILSSLSNRKGVTEEDKEKIILALQNINDLSISEIFKFKEYITKRYPPL